MTLIREKEEDEYKRRVALAEDDDRRKRIREKEDVKRAEDDYCVSR